MKLNLGCGKVKLKGYMNIDASPDVEPDIKADLFKRIPVKSNTVTEIVCDNFLEHVPIDRLVFFITEMWHVCKDGATIKILTVHGSGFQTFRDPTHYRGFSVHTFSYFSDSATINYYSPARFKIVKIRLIYGEPKKANFVWKSWCRLMTWLASLNPAFCERIWAYWVGGFDAIEYILEANKQTNTKEI